MCFKKKKSTLSLKTGMPLSVSFPKGIPLGTLRSAFPKRARSGVLDSQSPEESKTPDLALVEMRSLNSLKGYSLYFFFFFNS